MIFNTHSIGQNMYQKIQATEVAGYAKDRPRQ